MTREEAFKTIKENLCGMCAYGSQCMESCDIRGCDNMDAIKVLEKQPSDDVLDSLCNSLNAWSHNLNVPKEARNVMLKAQGVINVLRG